MTLITHVRRFFHISVRDMVEDSQRYEHLNHGEVLAAPFYLEYGGPHQTSVVSEAVAIIRSRLLSVTGSGGDGVVPGGDRGSHCRVGDAVWRQVGKFEEHLFQAAGNHEGEQSAAFGTCGDPVPGSARHQEV